eukprot:3857998-Pleurochrysis_carterae.AAC.1
MRICTGVRKHRTQVHEHALKDASELTRSAHSARSLPGLWCSARVIHASEIRNVRRCQQFLTTLEKPGRLYGHADSCDVCAVPGLLDGALGGGGGDCGGGGGGGGGGAPWRRRGQSRRA